jgi:hypothetical protein
VYDPDLVDVLNTVEQLMEQSACLLLRQPLAPIDVLEKLTLLHVLHHQEQLAGGLADLVQLHNIWMPHELQDVDLAEHTFGVRQIVDSAFLQYFDSNILVCQSV